MEITPLTEQEVRKIAREEALKVQKKLLSELADLRETTRRIERLLLGELGTNEEDTLKSRANFAFQYAKRNTELKVVDRALPAIEWFEDMNTIEPGCKESHLSTLGRILGLFTKIEWLMALLGITTLINVIPVVKMVVEWISSMN